MQIKTMCPPEIEVAFRNAPDSSTISGPADIMKNFVAMLLAQGIFAKEVPCSNIAYHSRYIAEAGPKLLKYLKEVIPTPKKRSDRWMCTSLPQALWKDARAQYSSAEYHTNNLLPIHLPHCWDAGLLYGWNWEIGPRITHHAGPVRIGANDCRCSRVQRLNLPSEVRRSSR
ncbi:hypothetical protein evm_006661 [Chilo suppressalis]|nr:hypothetical protein evm_006661 [Chilo suppressalis]